jgi:lipopolysaccharide biosynthesis glycosyltransferase
VAVTAADDRYALPLAAMVRSLIDHFHPRRRLRLYVLDGGISAHNRRKLEASWDLRNVELLWLRPDRRLLEGVPVNRRFGLASYFRLLIPRVLPATERRANYLYADTIVLKDLSRLWEEDLRGKPLGAVIDFGFRTLGKSFIAPGEWRSRASAPYFNSGMLLLDLGRWRKQKLAEKALAKLRAWQENVILPDQDALNATFIGAWRQLHPRWNICVEARYTGLLSAGPRERAQLGEALVRPGIVHFIDGFKPWQRGCSNPRLFLFFFYLDRTRWCGWRPE